MEDFQTNEGKKSITKSTYCYLNAKWKDRIDKPSS